MPKSFKQYISANEMQDLHCTIDIYSFNSYSAFSFKYLILFIMFIKERKCPLRGSVQTIGQGTFFIMNDCRQILRRAYI